VKNISLHPSFVTVFFGVVCSISLYPSSFPLYLFHVKQPLDIRITFLLFEALHIFPTYGAYFPVFIQCYFLWYVDSSLNESVLKSVFITFWNVLEFKTNVHLNTVFR
jgi:hypothetical protein